MDIDFSRKFKQKFNSLFKNHQKRISKTSFLLALFILMPIFLSGCQRLALTKPTLGQTKPTDPTVSASVALTDSAGLLLSIPADERVMGRIVNASTVILRSEPLLAVEVLVEAKEGDDYLILQSFFSSAWHKIEFNGQAAFIPADFLMILEPGATPPQVAITTALPDEPNPTELLLGTV